MDKLHLVYRLHVVSRQIRNTYIIYNISIMYIKYKDIYIYVYDTFIYDNTYLYY